MKIKSVTFKKLLISKNEQIKVQKWPITLKVISWLLIFSMLNITSGCMNYFKVRQSTAEQESINALYYQDKKLIIHYNNEAWIMEAPEVNDDVVTAIAKKHYVPKIDPVIKGKPNKFVIKAPENQYDILNEVHIYLDELTQEPNDVIKFPLSAVNNIELYEFDKSATNGSHFLGAVGGAVAVLGGFFLILMMTSCPFIYVPNDTGYALIGEIYSGSVQPALERNDFMKLPDIQDDQYKVKITNELKEIQHTNLMELWVYDHPKNTNILVDKYGNGYSIQNLIAPISARNRTGQEVITELVEMDDLIYSTEITSYDESLTDAVIAEFPMEENSDNARIIINAKNDLILDYMIGEFYDEMGDLYKRWERRQKKASEEKQRNWTLNQNIPLKLWVERNGNWDFVDYYHIVGPVAMKQDILSFPLTGEESNPLKIKLEFGKYFWNIDYVAINYGNSEKIEPVVVHANEALDQDNKSVLNKLLSDDQKYYNQETGTSAILNFELPENKSEARTIYLHSKGWYEIIRNPSGTPDREYLETFREPGRFNQYVNDFVNKFADKD